MTCDESRIGAFSRGELPDADELAFDEHLLACESCWRAVQEDRAGRLLIERLRVPAPPGLADRVIASISLAGRKPKRDGAGSGRRGRARHGGGRVRLRVPGRLAAAAVVVIAMAGGALGWVLSDHQAGDPPQIARVVAMVSPVAASNPALRGGERFDFGGQSLDVRSYRVEGVTILVATSASPFPMPASSHLVAGSSPTAWMGTDGRFAMYGVNRPAGRGRDSMFVVAVMPMVRLPQVAARLHLI